jgi:hypothetical protein
MNRYFWRGVPLMFPAELGPVTEGLKTGEGFFHNTGENFVWKTGMGNSVGRRVLPIYESAVHACRAVGSRMNSIVFYRMCRLRLVRASPWI